MSHRCRRYKHKYTYPGDNAYNLVAMEAVGSGYKRSLFTVSVISLKYRKIIVNFEPAW